MWSREKSKKDDRRLRLDPFGELKRSLIPTRELLSVTKQVRAPSFWIPFYVQTAKHAERDCAKIKTSRVCPTSFGPCVSVWSQTMCGVCIPTGMGSMPEQTFNFPCSLGLDLEITQEPYMTHCSAKATVSVFLGSWWCSQWRWRGQQQWDWSLPCLSVWRNPLPTGLFPHRVLRINWGW